MLRTVTRLMPLAGIATIVLLSAIATPRVHADATYVRDLAASPAEVRWRHSGLQGGYGSARYFGREMVTGDFNHDGRTDLAVGADTDTAPSDISYGRGFVYVYFGKGEGAYPALLDPAERLADCRIFGEAPFGYFGQELAVGDFDGDGIDDLAVSQIEGTTVYKGAVYLISGATIGANAEVRVDEGQYISKLSGRTTGTRYRGHYLFFGFAIAAADFNGDGVSDLAAGALGGYGIDGERPQSGDVSIFLGRRDGWPRAIVATNETADLFILGREQNTNFGTEIAAGDVDGDGRPELLVSTWASNGPGGSRSFSGDVSVFTFGRSSPFALPAKPGAQPARLFWDAATAPASGLVWGPRTGARLGSSASDGGGRGIEIGDFDGDGTNDVILGSPFSGDPAPNTKNPGAVYVVWGGASLTDGTRVDLAEALAGGSEDALLLAEGGPGESLGDTVRLADFNHDGRMDIIAGAPDANAATGYVAVFGGRPRGDLPSAGPLDAPDAVVRGLRAEWRAGDDAVYVDDSFAGHAMLAIGVPYGGYSQGFGRGYAGEVDAVLAEPIGAALRPQPSILLDGALTVAPRERRSVEIVASTPAGSIVSLVSDDLPRFAKVEPSDATAGRYTLALNPSETDRGAYEATLVATDDSGRTATRRIRITVGYTPAIAELKLKQVSPTNVRLTIVGTGFVAGEAIVTVDGVNVTPVKYPAAFADANGVTTRRMTVSGTRLSAILRPGQTATVRVFNPSDGLVSNGATVTR